MKKPPAPRILTVAIFTTVTVVFWIFFGVYRILTTKSEIKVSEDLLTPINPTLDIQTLETLSSKTFIREGESVALPINQTQEETSNLPSENEQLVSETPTPSFTTTPSLTP